MCVYGTSFTNVDWAGWCGFARASAELSGARGLDALKSRIVRTVFGCTSVQCSQFRHLFGKCFSFALGATGGVTLGAFAEASKETGAVQGWSGSISGVGCIGAS